MLSTAQAPIAMPTARTAEHAAHRQCAGDAPLRIHAQSIRKDFGATCALRAATLRLRPGRVHALMGENGAGKSTFVKILVGAMQADQGTLALDDRPLRLPSIGDAIRQGIVPVYQQLTVFPDLSVRENLSAFALAASRAPGSASALMADADALALLQRVGLRVALHRLVGSLSLAERQLVEIARALGQRCRVLILDEPTAALAPSEATRLFAVVRALCAEGTAVLFVSHKLHEVEAFADDVSVMRDGLTVIDCAPLASLTRQQIVTQMLGHIAEHAALTPAPHGAVVFEASGLRLARHAPASQLQVRSGEMVGLAGLAGSGVIEVGEVLAGARKAFAGSLRLGGKRYASGRRVAARRLGVGFVPVDRHADALFGGMSALANTTVCVAGQVSRLGWLRRGAERSLGERWLRQLRLHPQQPQADVAHFSGGNQQKVVVARSLAIDGLRLVIALEPTRGVDVGARAVIHDALRAAAARGVAVVIASSDLDEICALCQRVYLVSGQSIRAELQAPSSASLADGIANLAQEH
ncbi:MAG: D-xylose ABC transporter ATP-binding protein [Variovorax paradoxus]|nr:MAG: D-xylose ABC transporter ATP-binding protein [Variovorax paradoxus]PZQ00050.1 MAG: D-xylose ABC transporter ATP-binding protein [Variovorax paradoxus]